MKRSLMLFFFMAWVGVLQAEKALLPKSPTGASTDGRFEVVQSPLAVRWTFLLDKWAGMVWQLVAVPDGSSAWQLMRVEGLDQSSEANTKPKFQIFVSGIAAKTTFLLDAKLGCCWQLVSVSGEGEEEEVYWEPMKKF